MLNREKKRLKSIIANKVECVNKQEEYLKAKEECFTKKGEKFFNEIEDFKYTSPKTQYKLFEVSYNEEKKRYFAEGRKLEDLYLRKKLEFLNLKEKYLNIKEYYLVVKQGYLKDREDIFIPTETYLKLREEFKQLKIKFFGNREKHVNNNFEMNKINSNLVPEKQPKVQLNENCKVTNLSSLNTENDDKLSNLVWDHLKNNGYGNSNGRMCFYPEVCNNSNEVATTKQTSAKTPYR